MASGCSRCIAVAARRRRWRRSGTLGGSCSTRSGSSRVPSCAASTTRSCARTRISTVRPPARCRPVRGGAHAGCSSPPAWRSRGRWRSPSCSWRARAGSTRSPRTRPASSTPGVGTSLPSTWSGTRRDALAAGGGSVWIANGRDGTVSRVERGHGQVTTIDVGGEPTAVAFGGGSLWVADGQNRVVDQVDSAHEPRRRPPVRGQRAARGGGGRGRGVAHLAGRRAGGADRPREGGPDPADRGARRARCHRRGQRRGVGGRRGGRRRDQARSCLGRGGQGDRGRQRAGRDRRRLRRGLGRQPRRRDRHADRRGDRRGHRHGARRRQPGRGRRWARRRSGWPTAARAP